MHSVCVKCGSENVEPRKTIQHSGAIAIGVYCLDCGKWATDKTWVGKDEFTEAQVKAMPLEADYRNPDHPCCVIGCNGIGVEWHHFAPKHLFGPDADRWPGAWVCVTHHLEWHRLTKTGPFSGRDGDHGLPGVSPIH
jgi:hypothetical protein